MCGIQAKARLCEKRMMMTCRSAKAQAEQVQDSLSIYSHCTWKDDECSRMADTEKNETGTRLPAAVEEFHQRGALPRRREPRPALPHCRHAEVLAGLPHTVAGLPHATLALCRLFSTTDAKNNYRGALIAHPCKLTVQERSELGPHRAQAAASACLVPAHSCMGS